MNDSLDKIVKMSVYLEKEVLELVNNLNKKFKESGIKATNEELNSLFNSFYVGFVNDKFITRKIMHINNMPHYIISPQIKKVPMTRKLALEVLQDEILELIKDNKNIKGQKRTKKYKKIKVKR